jgi:undecaprenyl-phosphate 4-deoxy-4-formamido-L-arabinose transferase
MTKPDISVVVPVFNSETRLRELFTRTCAVITSMNLDFEFVFVDDGSIDKSWRVINELNAEYPERVRGFRLSRNSGQQAATVCGLERARGMWVVTLDDDLQSLPEEIPALWEQAKRHQADVVYGVYAEPKHRFLHRVGSRAFRVLLRNIAPNVPAGSSFRLINGEILQMLPQRTGPWLFVDPMLAWLTSDITTINVQHAERKEGRSGYSFFKLVHIALTVLVTYSALPLQLMIWFGLISAVISFGLGIYYLILRLTANVAVGFSALIVTMTFAFGVILLSMGVLGLYISRIYIAGTGQPAFIVKAEI